MTVVAVAWQEAAQLKEANVTLRQRIQILEASGAAQAGQSDATRGAANPTAEENVAVSEMEARAETADARAETAEAKVAEAEAKTADAETKAAEAEAKLAAVEAKLAEAEAERGADLPSAEEWRGRIEAAESRAAEMEEKNAKLKTLLHRLNEASPQRVAHAPVPRCTTVYYCELLCSLQRVAHAPVLRCTTVNYCAVCRGWRMHLYHGVLL